MTNNQVQGSRAKPTIAEAWQPIETARTDQPILGYCVQWFGEINGLIVGDPFITIMQGGPDYGSDANRAGLAGTWWNEIGGEAYASWVKPTHWMALPLAPVDGHPQGEDPLGASFMTSAVDEVEAPDLTLSSPTERTIAHDGIC